MLLFYASFSSPSQVLTAHGQSFQDHFQAAVSAYKAGEYIMMLEEIRAANALRPEHPTIIYYIAMGYVRRYVS